MPQGQGSKEAMALFVGWASGPGARVIEAFTKRYGPLLGNRYAGDMHRTPEFFQRFTPSTSSANPYKKHGLVKRRQ